MKNDRAETEKQNAIACVPREGEGETTDSRRVIDELLSFFRFALTKSKFPEIPADLAQDEVFQEIVDYLAMLRENLYRFSRGDLSGQIRHKGFVAGSMKELQAHLRHITWHLDRLASGDFQQHLDFMGEFAESFNRMSTQFYDALSALRESEANLLKLTEELHINEERWKLAVACTQDGIWDIDLTARTAFFSSRLWEILRRPGRPEELAFDPEQWRNSIHPDDREKWDGVMRKTSERVTAEWGREYTEFRIRGGDERFRWIGVYHMLLADEDGKPYRYVGACEDIQEKREREENIRIQATHDQLTGLPNRYLYNDRLRQQMVMAKRNDSSLILVVWDLDGFKAVNDTYGHLAGDQLLIAVAQRLHSCLRETDTLARFGGDEFVMLLSSSRGHETEVAVQMTTRILESLKSPIDVGPGKVRIGASCGISFFPKHSTVGEELFDMADKALYKAKHAGKNRAQVWIPPKSGDVAKPTP